MDQRSTESLWTAGRTAAVLCALHAGLTVWIVARPQAAAAPLFGTAGALVTEPALLLAGQVAALGGLLYLAITLRNVARGLANTPDTATTAKPRNADGPRGALAPTAAAVLFGTCSALGIWSAGHGFLGPVGLASLLLLPGSMALLAGLKRPTGGLRLRPSEVPPLVSRLRGASIVVAVSGLALAGTSGSLVAGSLLPTALLRHLPSGPPPTADAWDVPPSPAQPAFAPPPASAEEAGEAIHALFFAGSPRGTQPLERTPVRRHGSWWPLESPPTLPLPPHEWARGLFQRALQGGLDPGQMAFLRAQSLHPANDEFDRLANVATADIAGARWRRLDEQPVAVFELPVPRYVELWNGVRGRIAGATYLALEGDPDEARRRLETVVHLGRLLNQDGPLTLDAVLGARISEEALVAAQSLEASRLRATAASTAQPATAPPGAPTITERFEWLQRHQTALQTPDAPRGVRWEAFALVSSFLPCSSPAATLWGPGPDLVRWRTETGSALASRASEAEMADVLSEGYLGTRAGGDGWGWLPKVLGVTLGDRPAATHCAPLVAAVMGLY
ncbi:MAG: hypothetical protein ACR2QM_18005 [Longimicrobiales bacterium]